ncbi:hypothetical protein P7C73_g4161, partial [Tremellales sp. Uapishka_1]
MPLSHPSTPSTNISPASNSTSASAESAWIHVKPNSIRAPTPQAQAVLSGLGASWRSSFGERTATATAYAFQPFEEDNSPLSSGGSGPTPSRAVLNGKAPREVAVLKPVSRHYQYQAFGERDDARDETPAARHRVYTPPHKGHTPSLPGFSRFVYNSASSDDTETGIGTGTLSNSPVSDKAHDMRRSQSAPVMAKGQSKFGASFMFLSRSSIRLRQHLALYATPIGLKIAGRPLQRENIFWSFLNAEVPAHLPYRGDLHAVIWFETTGEARAFKEHANSRRLECQYIKDTYDQVKEDLQNDSESNLYIASLPITMDEDGLDQLVHPGVVRKCNILKDSQENPRGVIMARMSSAAEAQEVIRKVSSLTFLLKVIIADEAEQINGKPYPAGGNNTVECRIADSQQQKTLKAGYEALMAELRHLPGAVGDHREQEQVGGGQSLRRRGSRNGVSNLASKFSSSTLGDTPLSSPVSPSMMRTAKERELLEAEELVRRLRAEVAIERSSMQRSTSMSTISSIGEEDYQSRTAELAVIAPPQQYRSRLGRQPSFYGRDINFLDSRASHHNKGATDSVHHAWSIRGDRSA